MNSRTTSYQPEQCIQTLGPAFYDVVQPATFPQHIIRFRNQRWAKRVGLETISDNNWVDYFGRFIPLPGSLPSPLALRYHGHQFRAYNPDIGDGRGFLYAQLRDLSDNRLLDLATKGSGQTPYSRFGDGRLTLKGGVREVLATEMLEAHGVNTSKSFSLIETGEALQRNDEPSPTRSAVLVRLSHSHIRYGTFQRLAALNQQTEMAVLVDYVLQHFVPQSPPASTPLTTRIAALMDYAVAGAATLAASYMAAGFVHGVLNTDNINITGESFDYGPYRFAPHYDPGFTAAYFDQFGLYAYGRQAEALHWNIYQLAKALLLIVPQEAVIPALETFESRFETALINQTLKRLGLQPLSPAENLQLLQAMEAALTQTNLGLDRFFFDFYGGGQNIARLEQSPAVATYQLEPFQALKKIMEKFAPSSDAIKNLQHPYFADAAPCSLLIDEVEAIWSAIAEHDDWQPFHTKIDAIRRMGEAYGNCF